MAVLPILIYPNTLLKTVCEPVHEFNDELQSFIADLLETMENSPGCVGIAAPQVGMLKRIIIVDASKHRQAVANHGPMILINPEIYFQQGEVVAREGCLSLPDLTANVKRASSISLKAQTPQAQTINIEATDFEARVVLHEYDHLDGLLFLDRVSSLKTDVFRRKNYVRPQASQSVPGP